MSKVYGVEFPERALMSVISDLLGIDHYTTARGSTVRTDFLVGVGRGLGLSDASLLGIAKDDLLARVVEAATKEPMDATLYSPGATVTNRALQVIADGIIAHGVPGRPTAPDVESQTLDTGIEELEFDPAEVADERDRRLIEMAVRQGQDKFRLALLTAYGGRCALTDYDAVDGLQGAHIYPYRGPETNRVTNGLLLRADVHILFDRGGIAIDESSYDVLVRPTLTVTRYGQELDGRRLRLPHRRADRPSTAALRSHREWAGL
ncbi:HNH endonuclease [Knoellia sp. LjRoot47]|uniref:HNH endonuclease n=1 Tax=Knoellia sp. LjRoot47 TaxID=3342330 RepID=UPI003ECF651B